MIVSYKVHFLTDKRFDYIFTSHEFTEQVFTFNNVRLSQFILVLALAVVLYNFLFLLQHTLVFCVAYLHVLL